MKLCNESITVYNAKLNKDTGYDEYHRTVISGVSWFCEIASNVDGKGLTAANKFIIRIPTDADFSGKTYLPAKAYAESTSPDSCFTLREGDIIVRGIAPELSPHPADLHSKYDEVVTILGITDNRRGNHGKHWKVVGK